MRKAALTSAALAATALLALSACGSNAPEEGTEPVAAPESTSAAPAPATTSAVPGLSPSATASPTAPAVKRITLVVKDGKVTGDTGTVDLKVNQPFQVVVTSDVADQVHVHTETRAGFSGDVAAGGTVTIDAVIKAASKYDVELEGRKLTLTRLAVT